jgi:saccharopine dehydrogenase-like NADP-dependent oxidoreductase
VKKQQRKRQKLLIVGCGDVARRTLPRLVGRYRIFALLRDPAQSSFWRDHGACPVLADLDQPSTLKRLSGLADIVLHFAPPPERGSLDPRMRRLLAAL